MLRTTKRQGVHQYLASAGVVFLVLILVALALTSIPVMADDPEARRIMEKVFARDDGDNKVWDMEMFLIDEDGKERVRKARCFSKDQGKDTFRLMFFVEPPDVKDTAFLTYDYDAVGKDDDQWLYLPALRKTKRIALSTKSNSFMGSDFSFGDLTKGRLDDYEYSLLNEMKIEDDETWVIQSMPRTQKVIDEFGYTKSVILVRKDNFFTVRAIHWLKQKNRLKYMDVKSLEVIDGVWVATEIHMTTKEREKTLHKTIMRNNNIKLNQNLKESLFTLRQMEKGL